MPKPIRLTIREQIGDDLHKHRFEITVDVDGRAEIRNVDYASVAQRGPSTSLTVGSQPCFTHLEMDVE